MVGEHLKKIVGLQKRPSPDSVGIQKVCTSEMISEYRYYINKEYTNIVELSNYYALLEGKLIEKNRNRYFKF